MLVTDNDGKPVITFTGMPVIKDDEMPVTIIIIMECKWQTVIECH